MNILIPCIGSRGDVQPFIALAQGLKRAGHRVTLASHPVMQRLIESHGIEFAPIGFGTTSAGLRAGIPALVIPHMIDQFYWGQRLHELGVSPPAIQRPKLKRE